MIMKYHQTRGRHRLLNRGVFSINNDFWSKNVRKWEEEWKGTLSLNFWWDEPLWKKQSGRGVWDLETNQDSFSYWKNITSPFWWILKQNPYQVEITLRCSLCTKTSHGRLPKGRDRLQEHYKATQACTCSVCKAPDCIRFLIRSKCPQECRIKHSSHNYWIQNVKVVSISESMSST